MTIHVVARGETLSGIAALYGVSAGLLARWNGLPDPGALAVGQSLLVLFPAEVHIVRAGQTLSGIARDAGVSVRRIWQLNPNLRGGAAIYPGMALVLRLEGDAPDRPAEAGGYAYPSVQEQVLTGILPYTGYLAPFTYGISADGGLVVPDDARLVELARRYGLPIHIDGARIFNAATVLGMDVKELAPYYDTMSVCLSKGLCAPAGSVLIGSRDFIDRARRKRKIMGGGMRQVGFLAAPGILALEEMSTRLAEDHANAAYLAEKMTAIPGLHVLEDQRDINMVFFRLEGYPLTDTQLVAYMAENGVKINGEDNGVMRFATHYYVNRHDIDKVVALLAARA